VVDARAGTDSNKLAGAVHALAAGNLAGHSTDVRCILTRQILTYTYVGTGLVRSLVCRGESRQGGCNDWRLEFAADLRQRRGKFCGGASRHAARGGCKNYLDIWQVKPQGNVRLRNHSYHKGRPSGAHTRGRDALRAGRGCSGQSLGCIGQMEGRRNLANSVGVR